MLFSTMKRACYLFAFTFLGLLAATLLHGFIEIPLLAYLTASDERMESWLWQNWGVVHSMGSIGLWLLGALGGFLLGRRYWRILYVEERYGKSRY